MANNRNKSMNYLFLVLIIIYFIASVCYIFLNNFNREITPILFPTIGAILLSFYLWFNATYENKPENLKTGIPVAVLYDLNSERMTSMTNIDNENDMLEFINYGLGIGNVDRIDFSGILKEIDHSSRDFKRKDLILKSIENSFWMWLEKGSYSYMYLDYKSTKTLSMVSKMSNAMDFDKYEMIDIPMTEEHSNLLKRNLIVPLPIGSTVKYENDRYIIITKNAKVKINFFSTSTFEKIDIYDHITTNIFSSNKIDPKRGDYCLYSFFITIDYEIYPFMQFSNQSKIEYNWFRRINEGLKNDFSWEVIRNKFKNMN